MLRALQLVASIIALTAKGALSTAQGALKLDNYTLDKVLAMPGHSVLVKFDKSYAFGEKEDEFKTLCKLAYSVQNFLIGEVPVQEYGDKENDDLRERFKIGKDDFPVYFLFNEKNKEGKKYSGAIKAADIGTWLRQNQVRMPAIGTIDELDVIAKKFMKEKADADIEAAKKLAEEDYKTDRKAAMYVKIMQKIKEKGDGYIESETKRVSKILEGKVTPDKAAEMNDKLKILGIFTVAGKDEL
mmetsp:Transcript_5608/g.9351  ORF Transcript_5608/g.9351 Transcript_5608/m.9351 type:complete len:242 (-) Transcript_5608:70-795(-)